MKIFQENGTNSIFVPKSRRSLAAFEALAVFGQVRGFGFSAVAVDQSPPHGERRAASGHRVGSRPCTRRCGLCPLRFLARNVLIGAAH